MSTVSADIAGNIAGSRVANPNTRAAALRSGERQGWGPKAIAQRFNTWRTNHNITPIKGLQQRWTEFKANRARARNEAQMSRAQRLQQQQLEAAAANQARSHAAERTDAVAAYRAETSVDGALARTNALKTALTNNGYGTVAREVDILIVQIAQKNNSGQLQEARELLNKFMARDEVNNAIDWNNMQASRGQLTSETLTRDISALAADAAERSYRDTQRLTRATEKNGQQVQRGFRAVLRQIHDGIMNLPEAKALMSKLEKLSESKLAKMLPLVAMAAAVGSSFLIPGLAPFLIAGVSTVLPLYSAAMVVGRGSRAVRGAEDASYYGDEQTLKRADRTRQERIQNTAQSHMMSIFDADPQDGRSFQQRFDNCFDLVEGRYVLKNINSIRPELQAQFRADLEALRVTTEIARQFEANHDGRHAFTFRGNIPDGATITNGHQLDTARQAIENTRQGHMFSGDQQQQINTRLAQMETNLRADRLRTETGTALRVGRNFVTVPLAFGALNLIHTGGNVQEALQTVLQTSYVGKVEHLAGLVNTDILHHSAEAATNIQQSTVEIHFDKDHIVNGFPPETKFENGVLSYHGVDFAHGIKIEGNVLSYHSGPPGVDTPLRTINLEEMKEVDVNRLFEEQFADNPLTSAENMQSFMPDVVRLPDGTFAYVFSGDHLAHGVDWTNQQFSVFDGNGNNILVPMQNLQGLHLTSALTNMPIEHGIIVSADPSVSTHALGQFLNSSPNALSAEHYAEFYNTWIAQHGTPPLPSDVISATGQNLFSHQVGLVTDALSGHGDLIATNNLWDPHLMLNTTEALLRTPDVQGFNVMGQMMGGMQIDLPTIEHALQIGLSDAQHELGSLNPFQPGAPLGPGGFGGDIMSGIGTVGHNTAETGVNIFNATGLGHSGAAEQVSNAWGEVSKILHGDFQGVWNDFLNSAEHSLNMSQDQWNAMANDTHSSVSADGTFHLGQYVTGFGRHGIASFQFAGGMLFLTRFNRLPWNKGNPILKLPLPLARVADIAQMAFLSTALFGMPGLVGTLLLEGGAKTAALGVAPGLAGGAWRGIQGQWGPGGFARSGTTPLGRNVRRILGVPGVALNFVGGAVAGAGRGGVAALMTPLGFPPAFGTVARAGWTGNANPTAPAGTPTGAPAGAPPTPGAPGAGTAAFEQAMAARGAIERRGGRITRVSPAVERALGLNQAEAVAVLNQATDALGGGHLPHTEHFAHDLVTMGTGWPAGVTMNRNLAENLAAFVGVAQAGREQYGRVIVMADAIRQAQAVAPNDVHMARNAAVGALRTEYGVTNITDTQQALSVVFSLEHAFLPDGASTGRTITYEHIVEAVQRAAPGDIPTDSRPAAIAAICLAEQMARHGSNRYTLNYFEQTPPPPVGDIFRDGMRDALRLIHQPTGDPTYQEIAAITHAMQEGLTGTNRVPANADQRRAAIMRGLNDPLNYSLHDPATIRQNGARLAAGIAGLTDGDPTRKINEAYTRFNNNPPSTLPNPRVNPADIGDLVELTRALRDATGATVNDVLTVLGTRGITAAQITEINNRINPVSVATELLNAATITGAERTAVLNVLQQYGIGDGTDANFPAALQAAALAAVGAGRATNEEAFYTDLRDTLLTTTAHGGLTLEQARAQAIEHEVNRPQNELRARIVAQGINPADIITHMENDLHITLTTPAALDPIHRIMNQLPDAARREAVITDLNTRFPMPAVPTAQQIAESVDSQLPIADFRAAVERSIPNADRPQLVDAAIRFGLIERGQNFDDLVNAFNAMGTPLTEAQLRTLRETLRTATGPNMWNDRGLALEAALIPDQHTFRNHLTANHIAEADILTFMGTGAGNANFHDLATATTGLENVAAIYHYVTVTRGAAFPNFAAFAGAEEFVVAFNTVPYFDATEAFARVQFNAAHGGTPVPFGTIPDTFRFIDRIISDVRAREPAAVANIPRDIDRNIALFTDPEVKVAVTAYTNNAEQAFILANAGGLLGTTADTINRTNAIREGLARRGVPPGDIPREINNGAQAAGLDNAQRAAIASHLAGGSLNAAFDAFAPIEINAFTVDDFAHIAQAVHDSGATDAEIERQTRELLRTRRLGSTTVTGRTAAAAIVANVHTGTTVARAQAAFSRQFIQRSGIPPHPHLNDALEVLEGINAGLRATNPPTTLPTLDEIDTIAQAMGFRDIEQRATIIARQDDLTGGNIQHQTEQTFNTFATGHAFTTQEVGQIITGIRNANGIVNNTDANNANIRVGFNTVFIRHDFLRMVGVAVLDPQTHNPDRIQVAIDDWINGNVADGTFPDRLTAITNAQGAQRRNIIDALNAVGFDRTEINTIITAL